ncbi:MAG: nucleotidyltransferase domain-containing protein [Candidatus Aminicenantes bacterium]|nr:nucleotidyltransferase domain-containing protein [Candidatus Aminicenantes bacterium]
MIDKEKTTDNKDTLLRDLQERRKELNCLYKLDELLRNTDLPLKDIFKSIIEIIPSGWQHPEIARAKIEYDGKIHTTDGYAETPWQQSAEIKIQGEVAGRVVVSYTREAPRAAKKNFLKEEIQLINAIAERISHMIQHKQFKEAFNQWQEAEKKLTAKTVPEWRVMADLLHKSDPQLFMYLSQKMLHFLCWHGVAEARQLLEQAGSGSGGSPRETLSLEDMNQPSRRESLEKMIDGGEKIFRVAAENLSKDKILSLLRRWIDEDKSRFLVRVLENPNSSMTDLINAITRFQRLEVEGIELSLSIEKGLRVSLIRHFLSEQLEFINVAKNHIEVKHYYELVNRLIFPSNSHGKLGGKSSGLFLATRILKGSKENGELFTKIKIPRTWHITSDGLADFLHYNNLESVFEQKYKEMDEIHFEYKNIVQIFKNSYFSPEIIRGLSMAIDDLGDTPIIVRSSSLLEDRLGASFSGKYKSLFLSNQGSKQEKLDALMDATAEVYASTFGPDPIEYRRERGLLDYYEEMGILIQEVVGHRVGNYYLPTFAGVAFSSNEFRWSARIDRKDGLIRMVPGLGTRAVDRTASDYPILIAPGKPELRVNVTPDEIIRYSPRHIDVINLETRTFETIEVNKLVKSFGGDIPGIQKMVSILEGGHVRRPTSLFNIDFEKQDLLVTFEGFLKGTDFIKQVGQLLKKLEEQIGSPVDIEFAHDGQHLYLLQCRPQSYSQDTQPAPIPQDISDDRIAFSANRNISNGYVPNITHVVYVEPDAYNRLSDLSELRAIGRAVGKLNKILPKRQFILMGPGRWGSRGDIKLGVDVTYSDINNTAVLIEIARRKGQYIPELSFGTHFFQDLVEASIRYLPLYPDDEDIIFNETFFTRSDNILGDLLPEYASFAHTLRVIDVPASTDGLILRVLMNADLDEAIAIFEDPSAKTFVPEAKTESVPAGSDSYWRWRLRMVERIAARLEPERFGVKGFYVFGSTKNATAGPGSDIDILVHFTGTANQKKGLLLWLEGWSLTLAELNYQRTGYKSDGLLDIHLVTDEDIKKKTSWAVKIGAITDAARSLPMKNNP